MALQPFAHGLSRTLKTCVASVILVLSVSVASAQSVKLSKTSLTFSTQLAGTTSASQSVTMTNTGSATLTISRIAASGNFNETNTCGSSLAAKAACTIGVTFAPQNQGH